MQLGVLLLLLRLVGVDMCLGKCAWLWLLHWARTRRNIGTRERHGYSADSAWGVVVGGSGRTNVMPSPWSRRRSEKLGGVDARGRDGAGRWHVGALLVVLLEQGGDVHVHGLELVWWAACRYEGGRRKEDDDDGEEWRG